jgi:hypothetical protein
MMLFEGRRTTLKLERAARAVPVRAVLVLFTVLSCGAPGAKQPPRTERLATTSTGRGPNVAASDDNKPFSEFPAWLDWYNPLRWALALDQQPPREFKPISQLDGWRVFPFRGRGRVVAFELGGFPLELPQCSVIAENGTLCPNVVWAGRELSVEQRRRLETLFDALSGERRTQTCSGAPAAAFIWYDDDNRPVAHLTIEGRCMGWRLAPSPAVIPSGTSPATPNEAQAFATLCKELGYSRCAPESDHPAVIQHPEMQLARKVLPSALQLDVDVAANTLLPDTTPVQRRRLCAWSAMTSQFAIQAAGFVLPRYTTTLESTTGGDAVRFVGFDECIQRFADCARTVGDARIELQRVLGNLAEQRVLSPGACNFGAATVPMAR